MNNIKILHWNCFGIANKIPEIQYLADNYDIIGLQETLLLVSQRNVHIRGFSMASNIPPLSCGRDISFFWKINLKVFPKNLPDFNLQSIEMLGIEVLTNPLYIVSVPAS